jgi:hypothetical protein
MEKCRGLGFVSSWKAGVGKSMMKDIRPTEVLTRMDSLRWVMV